MTEGIIIALITGGLSLVGVILSNRSNARRMEQQLEMRQAVTDTKLDELTREVREHNNFARRMPVVEEQIKVINHRIKDLEDAKRNGTRAGWRVASFITAFLSCQRQQCGRPW